MNKHGYTIGESQTSTRILAFAILRAEFPNSKRVPKWLWQEFNEGHYLKVIRKVANRRTSK